MRACRPRGLCTALVFAEICLICIYLVTCSLIVILSLFLSDELHSNPNQPAPRLQEEKTSGQDARFECDDEYQYMLNTIDDRRRPSRHPCRPRGGGRTLLTARDAGRTTRLTPLLLPDPSIKDSMLSSCGAGRGYPTNVSIVSCRNDTARGIIPAKDSMVSSRKTERLYPTVKDSIFS